MSSKSNFFLLMVNLVFGHSQLYIMCTCLFSLKTRKRYIYFYIFYLRSRGGTDVVHLIDNFTVTKICSLVKYQNMDCMLDRLNITTVNHKFQFLERCKYSTKILLPLKDCEQSYQFIRCILCVHFITLSVQVD